MFEIRPVCEHCGEKLPNGSPEAMICTFECTFCKECVDNLLQNVCSNCGGGFVHRPKRPEAMLEKYPVQTVPFRKEIDTVKHKEYLALYLGVPPNER